MIAQQQLETGRIIEYTAQREVQTLCKFQYERDVPPITGATAGALMAGQMMALLAHDETHLELALERLTTIMRLHATKCLEARRTAARQ
jgi:hypothetical protein